ncbi:40s ribosomal protein s5-1 [Hordeum vulgare]|nr:40s ribosomal protein s5-1 [Hordeum vulgare]
METRLEAMEQQVFKCQGMVERGLNANHTMITEFTSNHKMDAIDIGKHLSRLYDRVDQLHGQIYDLQNQNSEEVLSVAVVALRPLQPLGEHGGSPGNPFPQLGGRDLPCFPFIDDGGFLPDDLPRSGFFPSVLYLLSGRHDDLV